MWNAIKSFFGLGPDRYKSEIINAINETKADVVKVEKKVEQEVKTAVVKIETAVVEEAKEAAAELVKKVETIVEPIPVLLVQHGAHSVEPKVKAPRKKRVEKVPEVVDNKVTEIVAVVIEEKPKATAKKSTKAKKSAGR